MKFVTEKQIAKMPGVRYDTVRHRVSIYKPGKKEGVYHFGSAVRIDRDTWKIRRPGGFGCSPFFP